MKRKGRSTSRCRVERSGGGFTLVELLVSVAIVVVLVALVFMGMRRVKEAAHRSASADNLRQIGFAMISFTQDNSGFLPASRRSGGGGYWPELIWPNLESKESYLRPGTPMRPIDPKKNDGEGYFAMADSSALTSEKVPIRWNYVLNGGHNGLPFAETQEDGKARPSIASGWSRPLMQIDDPSRTLMLAEGNGGWWLNAEAKRGSNRIRRWSNGKSNVLWFDGSVRLLDPDKDLRNEDFTARK